MTNTNRVAAIKIWGLALFTVLIIAGCSEPVNDAVKQPAVALQRGDECHLCGMIILNFPGPKSELYQQGSGTVRKFCSTRDMFSYALDPEHTSTLQSIWVHDMGKSAWDSPDDQYFTDARHAWYVINSEKSGAMGPALASFTKEQDAIDFAKQFQGDVLRYEELTLQVISSMTTAGGSSKQGMHHNH
jgi:copper chaperone NosL